MRQSRVRASLAREFVDTYAREDWQAPRSTYRLDGRAFRRLSNGRSVRFGAVQVDGRRLYLADPLSVLNNHYAAGFEARGRVRVIRNQPVNVRPGTIEVGGSLDRKGRHRDRQANCRAAKRGGEQTSVHCFILSLPSPLFILPQNDSYGAYIFGSTSNCEVTPVAVGEGGSSIVRTQTCSSLKIELRGPR